MPRHMGLFMHRLAEIEAPRLAVVVGEALGADTAFFAGFGDRSAMKAVGRLRVAIFTVSSQWPRSAGATRVS